MVASHYVVHAVVALWLKALNVSCQLWGSWDQTCVAEPCVAEPCVAEPCVARPCVAKPCEAELCVAKSCMAEPCVTELCVAGSSENVLFFDFRGARRGSSGPHSEEEDGAQGATGRWATHNNHKVSDKTAAACFEPFS